MLHLDLVFDRDDDATHAVRDALRDALHMLDLPPRWQEVPSQRVEVPAELAGAPRPAVYVNGAPVGNAAAPSRAQIYLAIQAVSRR